MEAMDDLLIFTFPVNLSIKNRKGERPEPDMKAADIPNLYSVREGGEGGDAGGATNLQKLVLTKRKLLALVMSQFDPTGLMSPILIKLKIELRKLFGKDQAHLG